jgi:hypothetical protein
MRLRNGEERTAGSDPRIRFSSGGPISLDPELQFFFFTYNILPSALDIKCAALKWWRGGVGVGGGGGGGGGGVVLYIVTR